MTTDSSKSAKSTNSTPFSEIWKTLSTLDLKDKIEKKMNLNYLSWANAWGVMMEYYPNSTFKPLPDVRLENGTVEVWCLVNVDGHERTMWLPVMNHKNMAITNPTSREISDARMRCLVKCLAMFGLGLYLYQGEDLPTNRVETEPKPAPAPQEVMEAVKQISEANTPQELLTTFNALTDGHLKTSDYYVRLQTAAAAKKKELQNVNSK